MNWSSIIIIIILIFLTVSVLGSIYLGSDKSYSPLFGIIIFILIVLLIILIVYKIYHYIARVRKNEPLLIPGEINARGGVVFPSSLIPTSVIGSEYTYSFWLYPSGWDYRFGKPKHVLSRGSDPRNIDGNMYFNPGIWFYPQSSNLMIRFDTYNSKKSFISKPNQSLNIEALATQEESENPIHDVSVNDCKQQCLDIDECQGASYDYTTRECHLSKSNKTKESHDNIDSFVKTDTMNPYQLGNECFNPNKECDLVELPLQRWSHVSVVLWNRTTDIYLNGKLVRSCILSNVPKVSSKTPLYVCQDGGFDGKFSQLRYFNRALNADEVYQLYRKGPVSWSFMTNYQDNYKYQNKDQK